MKPGRATASFDSATGMLRALSRYLAGQDVPALGQLPRHAEPAAVALLAALNRLPEGVREHAYAMSGVGESIPRSRAGEIDAEEVASWVVDHYPKRRYPVIFVGSSNGALVHLAAALDAPWLPQTLLFPIRRRGVDRDDPRSELRAGLGPGDALLDNNRGLALHHMHDPNQDRLMIAGMSYFRTKFRHLPAAYERFLRESLAPGGTLVTVECDLHWPSTRVNDRHFFQFGAYGGATFEEYHSGGPRVAEMLREYGSQQRSWDPPETDVADAPEAEWGFDTALLADLARFSREQERPLRRLRFAGPEDLSPAVANLYRDWYARRGLPTNRLLGESFLLMEPWWALRTGSVPYWLAFNTLGSHRSLRSYLDIADPYDEIRLLLFSHGADSIGLATADDWSQLANRATKVARLVGVDAEAYPRDFAVLARGHRELTRTRQLYPMPEPIGLSQAEKTLRAHPELEWSTYGG